MTEKGVGKFFIFITSPPNLKYIQFGSDQASQLTKHISDKIMSFLIELGLTIYKVYVILNK